MQFTPSQAAKEVGKTKQGIIKAIKDGRLSANRIENGGYLIDAAELFRVYEPVRQPVDGKVDDKGVNISNGLLVEVATLREQVKHLTELRQVERRLLGEQIEDLRAALESERQTVKHLTHEKQSANSPEKPASSIRFWPWSRATQKT